MPTRAQSPAKRRGTRRCGSPRASALGRDRARRDLIIGSDQVADLDGQPLGKPGDHPAALAQLRAMRGRVVVFHTALCLLDARSGRCELEDVPTAVRFRHFTDAQAARYLEADAPYDCAGSAKIESLGIALVESVESTDPSALIGLPLIALARAAAAGTDLP